MGDDSEQKCDRVLGYVNGRPKTRYEYLLEMELDARKSRQKFTVFVTLVCLVQFIVIGVLSIFI